MYKIKIIIFIILLPMECICKNVSISEIDSLIEIKNSRLIEKWEKDNNELVLKIEENRKHITILPANEEKSWQNILTIFISFLAIIGAYYGIFRQVKSNEAIQNRIQSREWCYKLIEYVSSYINEIDMKKSTILTTILKGKTISEKQAILEIKIDLWLDSSINEERKLLETILAYRSNSLKNDNFDIVNWMNQIKNDTHNVINSKW